MQPISKLKKNFSVKAALLRLILAAKLKYKTFQNLLKEYANLFCSAETKNIIKKR